MTTISLHETPEWSAVVRQQLRAVGGSLRWAGLLLLGIAVVLWIAVAVAAGQAAAHASPPLGFAFDPAMTLPVFLLGMFAAAAVWQREEPSRRGYHLAMPIAGPSHTVIRVFAGWAWCMVAVVGYWVALWTLGGLIVLIAKGTFAANLTPWLFAEPFAAATMTYLLTSIVMILAERPGAWIVSLPVGLMVLFALPDVYHARALSALFARILDSPFSPTTPFWAVYRTMSADHRHWLYHWQHDIAGTAIWTTVGLVGVWFAARRRPSATK